MIIAIAFIIIIIIIVDPQKSSGREIRSTAKPDENKWERKIWRKIVWTERERTIE